MDSGLHLAGGAAATGLLATVLAEQTGIAIHRPAEPSRSVAAGLGIVLD
jgi:actin-like ATPase involved in cell morphogenesis